MTDKPKLVERISDDCTGDCPVHGAGYPAYAYSVKGLEDGGYVDACSAACAAKSGREALMEQQREKSHKKRCPYHDCGFTGTDAEVDDHRTTQVHAGESQEGSNLKKG